MKKVLMGMICDGKAGGVDKYIFNFYETVKSENVQIDFLTNKIDEDLQNKLAQEGAGLFCVSGLKKPGVQYRQTKELIEKQGYNVVYMNISTALSYPVLKAAHDCGVKKVIAHAHASGYDCFNDYKRKVMTFLHKICKKKVCCYANQFLACSDKAAEWMFTPDVIKGGKVKIIQNTVDVSLFSPDEEKRQFFRKQWHAENKFIIGNVGNMLYAKNQLFLLDVFKKITEVEPEALLVIIGDGPLQGKIEEKIAYLKLQDKVILPGRVDVSEGHMNAFDVFAFPSVFEGLGIVLIEAQCSLIPCVASDAVPESASVSNMCKFVSTKNVEKWVETVLKLKRFNKADMVLKSSEQYSLEEQSAILKGILD